MAEAGADVLVPHMGLTTGGAIGGLTSKTLDECVPLIQGMHDAAKKVNPEILVLCHGGPIAEPDDAAYVLERTEGIVGFFGASSMERLPTETAMTENMKRFKAIRGLMEPVLGTLCDLVTSPIARNEGTVLVARDHKALRGGAR